MVNQIKQKFLKQEVLELLMPYVEWVIGMNQGLQYWNRNFTSDRKPFSPLHHLVGRQFSRLHRERYRATALVRWLPETPKICKDCSGSSTSNLKNAMKWFVLYYLCMFMILYFDLIHLSVPFSIVLYPTSTHKLNVCDGS